ncbi:MAG: DUF4249 domain-containing protein [Bacteroidota bacterium]
MRQIITILLLSVIFISATCERPLDLQIEEPDAQLVVISNFTNDENIKVVVSKTLSILDESEMTFIEDARVSLYEEENLIQELIREKNSTQVPVYTTSNFNAKTNVTYTIMVEVEGFAPVMAESSIPDKVAIQSLEVTNYYVERYPSGEEDHRYNLTLGFMDPEELMNYYHLQLFHKIGTFSVTENDTVLQNNEMRSVRFANSVDNNFTLAHFDGGIMFEDIPFDGKFVSYTFPIELRLRPDEEIVGKLLVELRSLSEQYYRYQRSLSLQQQNPGVPFAEPVVLYNNVVNGQGIFAGYNPALDSISIRR